MSPSAKRGGRGARRPKATEVAIKFGNAVGSRQATNQRRLEQTIEALVGAGSLESGLVQAVFPGDDDAEMASLFVVELFGMRDVDFALNRFREIADIEYADLAADRRPI